MRTYAPRGQTPVLRVPLTRDHLSAISAITPAGKLYMHVRQRALRGPDVVRFLRHLLDCLPGKLLVIWDGSPIHRARAVKAFLAAGAAARLQLEQLPAYAPDTNPDEGIWNLLKRVELRNVCCRDLRHLRASSGGLSSGSGRSPTSSAPASATPATESSVRDGTRTPERRLPVGAAGHRPARTTSLAINGAGGGG